MADDKPLQQFHEALKNPVGASNHAVGHPDVCVQDLSKLRNAAKIAADRAQMVRPSRMRPATAGAFQAKSGCIFDGESHRGPDRPTLRKEVQGILDAIPKEERAAPHQHGKCFEPRVISELLEQNIDPSGGIIDPRKVRATDNRLHGDPIEPCSSCKPLLKAYNVQWIGEI